MTALENFGTFAESKNCKVKFNEPLKNHTTFRVGGNADLFLETDSDTLPEIVSYALENNIEYFVMGNGSNLLISDEGMSGAVIRIFDNDGITLEGDVITVKAGVKLSKLCNFACENSLSGLEFAFGIPGSVGGALFMNAGAYGGEMKDVVISAKSFDGEKIVNRTLPEMNLGYRTSVYKTNDEVITSVKIKLRPDNADDIRSRMNDFLSRRTEKQPLDYPSAGSTFKRPEGYFAAALIEECGLKGYTVGGAQVSKKHSGFVINIGNATCKDVLAVIDHVQDIVLKGKGVSLETEVIYKGR